MKQKQKENKKKGKSPASFQHLNRFNKINDENPDKPKLSKQEKLKMFKDLCEEGPVYVIDCEFEDKMGDKDLKSLGQQLAYCYSLNKKQKQPLNIYFTGVENKLKQILNKANAQNWVVNIEQKQYLDIFKQKKEKLVYLTADSENLIHDLDPDMIYIIGGIVDHNKYKKLTYNKAIE